MCSCKNSVSHTKNNAQLPVADTAQLIKEIKTQYAAINSGSYTKKNADLSGLSAEGGTVTSYHDQKGTVKDHVVLYGEMGKVELDLYYNTDGLFFEYKKETAYDQPMYVKGSKVKSVTEDRYYFHKNRMIRWITAGHKIISPENAKFKEEGTAVRELDK
jgi:hypothetical protein